MESMCAVNYPHVDLPFWTFSSLMLKSKTPTNNSKNPYCLPCKPKANGGRVRGREVMHEEEDEYNGY